MRYQERIYIQNAHTCIRNRDHFNVNMSSDICIFNRPTFGMVGGDKIITGTTSSDHNVHIINTGTTIPLTFNFSGDVESFVDTEATFKYRIYKYNESTSVFTTPPKYSSPTIQYSSFSATSAFTNSILVSSLTIDGEYLVKGSFDFKVCTDILNKMGDTIDTNIPLIGTQYGLYTKEYDYYFVAMQKAVTPIFALSPTETRNLGALSVESFILSGETFIEVSSPWSGNALVSLNGLTLYEGDTEDFTTENNNTIYLNAPSVSEDILTVAYVNSGNPNGLLSESTEVQDPIVSGVTDGEGTEVVYYNTDTSKYELFMLSTPIEFNDVIVTLNGITLANGFDYVQSTSNTRRIILNGIIYPLDIINITYNSYGTYVGGITVDIFDIFWTITPQPINNNGFFTTLVAPDDTFGQILFSAETPYIINETTYSETIDLSTYTGTSASYKVVNQKNYTLISGDTISSIVESEVIPIIINI